MANAPIRVLFAIFGFSSASSSTTSTASIVPPLVAMSDDIANATGVLEPGSFVATRFEVSGLVQGVFFRKHAKAKADELGLTGWCRNTPRGTVEGEFEYEYVGGNGGRDDRGEDQNEKKAEEFRRWLRYVGSPRSRIEGCTFSEEAVSSSRRFDRFRVIR